MTTMIQTLRNRVEKRAAYRRTLKELRATPMDVRLDLEIAGIEEQVARNAVYG